MARHLDLPSQHEIEEMRVPGAAQFHPSVLLTDYVRPDGALYQSAAEPDCADAGGGRDDVQAEQTHECERALGRVLPVSAAREGNRGITIRQISCRCQTWPRSSTSKQRRCSSRSCRRSTRRLLRCRNACDPRATWPSTASLSNSVTHVLKAF